MQSHIHYFPAIMQQMTRPKQFTYPFHYTPHPLCVWAAGQVQAYLAGRSDWQEELERGKMFGVLVVEDRQGTLGFLAAFSGILAGQNKHAYFVPPVYDLLQPDGFFKQGEAEISALNHRIESFRSDEAYVRAHEALKAVELTCDRELAEARSRMVQAKAERDRRRSEGTLPAVEESVFIRESQYLKAEYKRTERRCRGELLLAQQAVQVFDKQLEAWKAERHRRSSALQEALFHRFRLLNARGETKDLCRIFTEFGRAVPPAGSGECAAPKLLQYAYANRLRPLCMAEFWWGRSPRNELRRHGYYYPSCRNKCEPILHHMLEGLEVEPNPLRDVASRCSEPRVVWEDACLLLVDKPAGMLSVPGKEDVPSVFGWMQRQYPQATGPLVVHRLDMATSGLLLLAKTKEVHAALQAQFETRAVRKRYAALLDGIVRQDEGFIRLPLCLDVDNRPRQMVSEVYGKPSVTRYEVTERTGSRTRIAFYPLTGRTHQLRVHAAHPSGLDAPIVGDMLYGHPADRLYLHAEQFDFRHPITGQWVKVECKAPF